MASLFPFMGQERVMWTEVLELVGKTRVMRWKKAVGDVAIVTRYGGDGIECKSQSRSA